MLHEKQLSSRSRFSGMKWLPLLLLVQQTVPRETSHTRRRVPSRDRRNSKNIPGWMLEISLILKFAQSALKCSQKPLRCLRNVCLVRFLWSTLSRFRFCMPMRESAGRRRTWRQSHRATRPTVFHTKATSSSPRCITSLPTVRRAPSLCGTSSSRLRPWSVAAATSSATKTTSTKRRTLLLLAKVQSWRCRLFFEKTSSHKLNVSRFFRKSICDFPNDFGKWNVAKWVTCRMSPGFL